MQGSALCRSRRELSNEYLLAKFGFCSQILQVMREIVVDSEAKSKRLNKPKKENEKGIELKTENEHYLFHSISIFTPVVFVFTVLEESGQVHLSCARIPVSLFFSGKDRTYLLACLRPYSRERASHKVWSCLLS